MATAEVTVNLDDFEQRMVVQGMVDFRNRLIEERKPTEDVDEILLKVINAPERKKRREERCER